MTFRSRSAWISAAAALLMTSGVMAQTMDHKVVVEDSRIAAALQKAAGKPTVDESVVLAFTPYLYSDNKISANESDLIYELLRNRAGTIEIAPKGGKPFEIGPLSPAALDLLALTDPPDIDKLWLAGTPQMKQLIDVTLVNPNVLNQVEQFVGQQLSWSWRVSNVANNYKPLRDTLYFALQQIKGGGPATEKRGRQILYEAMKNVDVGVKGAVPDDIYADLKPAQ